MSRTIYALFYLDDGAKRYFYVGRSVDVFRREKQHRYAKTKGHEDKYEFIRQLEAKGVDWQSEALREIPEGEHPPDNERWFVIHLTRAGHTLTNMRHGSPERLKELAEQVRNPLIRSVKDVERNRVLRKFATSRRFKRRLLEAALRTEGIPDVAADGLLPPILRRRLLAKKCFRVEKGVTLSEIIRLERAEPMFRRLLAGKRSDA